MMTPAESFFRYPDGMSEDAAEQCVTAWTRIREVLFRPGTCPCWGLPRRVCAPQPRGADACRAGGGP